MLWPPYLCSTALFYFVDIAHCTLHIYFNLNLTGQRTLETTLVTPIISLCYSSFLFFFFPCARTRRLLVRWCLGSGTRTCNHGNIFISRALPLKPHSQATKPHPNAPGTCIEDDVKHWKACSGAQLFIVRCFVRQEKLAIAVGYGVGTDRTQSYLTS